MGLSAVSPNLSQPPFDTANSNLQGNGRPSNIENVQEIKPQSGLLSDPPSSYSQLTQALNLDKNKVAKANWDKLEPGLKKRLETVLQRADDNNRNTDSTITAVLKALTNKVSLQGQDMTDPLRNNDIKFAINMLERSLNLSAPRH